MLSKQEASEIMRDEAYVRAGIREPVKIPQAAPFVGYADKVPDQTALLAAVLLAPFNTANVSDQFIDNMIAYARRIQQRSEATKREPS